MSLRILTGCLLLCSASANAATEDAAAEETINAIYRHVTEFEQKYPGNYARTRVTVRELDPDDGEVRKTKTMDQEVWNYVGERARVEIRSCIVDGKKSEIKECERKDRGGPPPYRIFGPEGREHYRFELNGPEEHNGLSVYRLRVVPREPTPRHFDGELYFAVDGLRLVRSNGTIGEYPLGLRKLDFDISFDELDGVPVPGTSKMDMTLYLPLILNVRVVSESTASEQRLIAADERHVSGVPSTDATD